MRAENKEADEIIENGTVIPCKDAMAKISPGDVLLLVYEDYGKTHAAVFLVKKLERTLAFAA